VCSRSLQNGDRLPSRTTVKEANNDKSLESNKQELDKQRQKDKEERLKTLRGKSETPPARADEGMRDSATDTVGDSVGIVATALQREAEALRIAGEATEALRAKKT